MSRNNFHRANGEERVFKITLEAGEAVTANASNYHYFVMRLVRDGQTYGEKVGETYSLAARSLVANEAVTLYDDAVGLAMSDGETLALYIEETGSPAPLERLVVWVDTQRRAR